MSLRCILWDLNFLRYVLPRIIAGAIISFFTSNGGDYSREAVISNIVHWKSCRKYFVLLSNQINWTWVFEVFQIWSLDWFSELESSLISLIAGSDSTLTWQGGDERKTRWREGWGRLFEGGDYFEYFHQRGTAIIRGNTVLKHICVGSVSSASVDYMRSNTFHTSLR